MGENKIKKFLVFLSIIAVLLGFWGSAEAASLFFSPSSGSHKTGTIFSVGVYVSSSDQPMNTASGTVSFPKDKLEVLSVSKAGSIINLCVSDPTYSNSLGTVSFEGVVFNPGYIGGSGRIISITFRTRSPGAASLLFSSGSVLANDHKGTNIITATGNANFTIYEAEAPKEKKNTPTIPVKKDVNPESVPDPVINKVEDNPSSSSPIAIIKKVGVATETVLSILIPIVALLFLLTMLVIHGLDRIRRLKKNVRKETKLVEQSLHKAVTMFKDEISEEIEVLEGIKSVRKLTEEEEKVARHLKKSVDDMEKFIQEELEKIEKQVK